MPIVALNDAEVAVADHDVLAIFGVDGTLHHALRARGVTHGVFLADGRLVVFGGGAAWVLREGAPERTVDLRFAHKDRWSSVTVVTIEAPEVLPNGVVFDGDGPVALWLDPDTGEVATLATGVTGGLRADGRRIDTTGLRAPGAEPARPQGLGATTTCQFVPGDPRAWCVAPDTCDVLAFTFDGALAGRVAGCGIDAVGPGSLVVEDEDGGDRWIDVSGARHGVFPMETTGFRPGRTAIAAYGPTGAFVEVDGADHLLVVPTLQPADGVVVQDRFGGVVLDPDGHVVERFLDTTAPEPRREAVGIHGKSTALGTTFRCQSDSHRVRLELTGARHVAASTEMNPPRAQDGVVTAWDLDTGGRRWVSPPVVRRLWGRFSGPDLVLAGGTGEVLLDGRTGALLLRGQDLESSEDGALLSDVAGGSTRFYTRGGRRLGHLPDDTVGLGVVGDVVVGWLKSRAPRTQMEVVGADTRGVRWERVTERPPVMRDGRVYAYVGGSVLALDPRDGHTLWTHADPDVLHLRTRAVDPNPCEGR